MQALVMAGGLGTRLRPLTEEVPKPLLPIGGRPILELILGQLRSAGAEEVFISVGYKADLIRGYVADGRRLGLKVRYVDEPIPLGTAGALGYVKDEVRGPLLTMNGDILTKLDFRTFHQGHVTAAATITLGVREDRHQIPFGLVETSNGLVTGIREKPVHEYLVSAGIYVLSPEAIQRVTPGQRLDIPDLINDVVNRGGVVRYHVIREKWIDIGAMEDFHRANEEHEDWASAEAAF
ncbi:MAG: nucleotidyltransferase family protein [Gemmatimonadaceae bacterium]